jgi:putative DNA primase/helicase
MTQDDYIPKYSNTRVTYPRRTVFVGTTNEQHYLKGLSGNTRFLPIPTQTILVDLFEARRDQLFAEALVYYSDHLQDWWRMPGDVKDEAIDMREERRHVNEYEDKLRDWLAHEKAGRTQISWEEIATEVLRISTPEGWKDHRLLMLVRQAMSTLGWVRKPARDLRDPSLAVKRLWLKSASP